MSFDDLMYSDQEDESSVRRTNKVLRKVNGLLRRHVQRQEQTSDEIFLALCEEEKSAERAFGELWGSGEFDCGPQDYDYMVERCLAAVREYNQRRTKPMPADPNWQNP